MKKSSPTLTIISHTPHFIRDGLVYGFGPTVREINFLAQFFANVTHVAPLHNGEPKVSGLTYSPKVRFAAITRTGGPTLISKVRTILLAPAILLKVLIYVKHSDYFQFRAPAGIGVFLIPVLSIIRNKGWFKYAGNWIQDHPPLGYRIQRWYLKCLFKKKKVTINGKWNNQAPHLISFENPCLTVTEIETAMPLARAKDFSGQISIIFVGRVEKAKGVGRLLEAISLLPERYKRRLYKIHIVGDGRDMQLYQNCKVNRSLEIIFHSNVSREELPELYLQSHFLVLPTTASEGFPKVLAEAMAYGCVPIVSAISSIGQYINTANGYLISDVSPIGLSRTIQTAMAAGNENLRKMASGFEVARLFTFERYSERIISEILDESV